ncbi:MAG: S26 family signal peptidase [Pirellulales bacterium]|nr:S26 family signal peptidase [Pirellulales bacterium]
MADSPSHIDAFRKTAAVWMGGAVLLLVILTLVGGRWLFSSHRQGRRTSELPARWRVSGASMVPTLYGPSRQANCPTCQRSWKLEMASLNTIADRRLCAHCGSILTLSEEPLPGELVWLDPSRQSEPIFRGELVAIHRESEGPFLKRVVGLPGDTVDVAGDGFHLMINGRRAEDVLWQDDRDRSLPRFLVDQDRARPTSRWLAEEGSGWRRDEQRQWNLQQPFASQWLIYRHQSVYDQNRASAVLDDYQYNVSATRKLHPVDRFFLSGHCRCPRPAIIEVAFWSAQTTMLARVRIDQPSKFQTSYFEAHPTASLPVSSLRPVALRVLTDGAVTLSSLTIERLIEYRLRRHDDREIYPVKVGPNRLFVLGDNVPVSVDSRNDGLLTTDRLLGRVRTPVSQP